MFESKQTREGSVFIGPESDQWLCFSLTHSLTDSEHLVNMIDATLACKDATSKLAKAVTAAGVDDEDHVGSILVQI